MFTSTKKTMKIIHSFKIMLMRNGKVHSTVKDLRESKMTRLVLILIFRQNSRNSRKRKSDMEGTEIDWKMIKQYLLLVMRIIS